MPKLVDAGFTLIEVLVAMAISTLLITAVYKVVGEGSRLATELEQRQQRLNELLHFRRVMTRDFASLQSLEEERDGEIEKHQIELLDSEFRLNVSGSVVRNRQMGPLVHVYYRWGRDEEGTETLERRVVPLGGDPEESKEVIQLSEGITAIQLFHYQQEEWKELSLDEDEKKLRGVRFLIESETFGEWPMLFSLHPQVVAGDNG